MSDSEPSEGGPTAEEILPLIRRGKSYDPEMWLEQRMREERVDEQMIAETSLPVIEVFQRIFGRLPECIEFEHHREDKVEDSFQIHFFVDEMEEDSPTMRLRWVMRAEDSIPVMGPGHLGWVMNSDRDKHGIGNDLGRTFIVMKEDIGRRLGYTGIAFDVQNPGFWSTIFSEDSGMDREAIFEALQHGAWSTLAFGPWRYEDCGLDFSYWVRDIQGEEIEEENR